MVEVMLELWAWGKVIELAFGGVALTLGLGTYLYANLRHRKLNSK